MSKSEQSPKPPFRPNREEAEKFLRLLKGNDVLVWQLIHDQEKNVPAPILIGSLEEVWPQLCKAQEKGYGTFITVNRSNGQGRKTKDMVAATAVFVDGDGIPLPSSWALPPHLMVQRDHNHWHAYWLIEPTSDFNRWKLIQKGMIKCLGTDPVIHDPPRVMRVPGFYHQKGDPILVHLKKCIDPKDIELGLEKRVTIDDIEKAFALDLSTGSISKKSKPKVSQKGVVGTNVQLDLPEAIQKGIQYLDTSAPIPVQGENGNNTLYEVTAHLKDWAISEKQVGTLLLEHLNPLCLPPWTAGELRQVVHNAFKYGKNLPGLSSAQQSPKKKAFGICMEKLKNADLGLAFNEFSHKYVLTAPSLPWRVDIGRELNDDLIRIIRQFLMEQFDWEATKENVYEAAMTRAIQNRFHPVRDYLRLLKWDGRLRLDTWLPRYMDAEDSPHTQAVGAKSLLGAVARVLEPGCKFDAILVFEGKQGSGKSSAIKILAGDEWFCDAPLTRLEDADAVAKIQGVWLYELAELSTLAKAAPESLKAFITRRVDRARLPYERAPRDFPRQVVFMGTTNSPAYLLDPTGNRRFWPVHTGTIDLEGLARDRDQLWAEAYTRWMGGQESLALDPSLYLEAERQQENRRVEDPWEDKVRAYLTTHNQERVHTKELLESCLALNSSQQHSGTSRRLHEIMDTLGWTYKRSIRIKKENRAGYENPNSGDLL